MEKHYFRGLILLVKRIKDITTLLFGNSVFIRIISVLI